MQGFSWSKQACFNTRGGRRLEEHLKRGRGIDHDHGSSRSLRMTSAGDRLGMIGVRWWSRARSSPIVSSSL